MKYIFKNLLKVLYYTLIGLNIGNLWLITDKYTELDLTREQKNVYFSYIFTQIFMLLFLAQNNERVCSNILTLFNIIYGPIILFKYNLVISSSNNKFFTAMNGLYLFWWFICTIGFCAYFTVKYIVSEYCCVSKNSNEPRTTNMENFNDIQYQPQAQSPKSIV